MTIIRVRFTKKGEASYISLLDLQRVMSRALKISKLPVYYTQGFNPHIYQTFAVPLALGQESECEVLDFKTEMSELHWERALNALNAGLPKGIVAEKMYVAKDDVSVIAKAVYRITYPDAELFTKVAQQYNESEQAIVEKQGKKKKVTQVNLKDFLPNFEVDVKTGSTVWHLPAGSTFNINPMLVLEYLEKEYNIVATQAQIMREDILTKNNESFC